jgi:hypothetical protein
VLVTRPSPQLATVELRFQFRYAAAQPGRLRELNPQTVWFSSTAAPPGPAAPRCKVEKSDLAEAMADIGDPARYTELRGAIILMMRRWLANRARRRSTAKSRLPGT